MNNEDKINTIEISVEQAKKDVAIMKAVHNLGAHPDFVNVVIKGYFETEAHRLVMLKAEPAMQSDEMQKSIIKSMDAIGSFRQYMIARIHEGRMAEKAIIENQETIDSMREEDMG